jgi:hypothetical protein
LQNNSKRKRRKQNLKKQHWLAIESLKNNESIKIISADKGNVTVVMNQSDYEEKLLQRIEAGSNTKIKRNPLKSKETMLNKLITEIMEKDTNNSESASTNNLLLRRKDLWKYKTSDAPAPWLYGLIKVHKSDMPLREISSATDSPGHELMGVISSVLQPLVGKKSSFVKDGYHFVSILKSERFKRKNGIMVSLDITALFPSLPMKKALEILKQRLLIFDDLPKYTDLSAEEIMSLIEDCVQNPWFECEFGRYIQNDGAPMGGPLSCLLSDLFLEYYETLIIFQMDSQVVDVDWLRYRDDTWFIWEQTLDELKIFVEYLNSIDPQIQWTYEVEKDHSISFLDVFVTRDSDGNFITSVYRKPTHSDRYLHYSSNHPIQQKVSAIHTLKYRALAYCSEKSDLEKELSHLQQTFLMNGYPEKLLNRILFEEKMPLTNPENIKDIGSLDGEKVGCLVIPYIPELHKQMVTLCKNTDTFLLYCRSQNLSGLIAPKRPKPQRLDTREVVYKIPCGDCNKVYIGETKRRLGTRCDEHEKSCIEAIIKRKVVVSDRFDSGLPKHALENNHSFDFGKAEILWAEKNLKRRRYLEAIEILRNSGNTTNIMNGKRIDTNWKFVLECFRIKNFNGNI